MVRRPAAPEREPVVRRSLPVDAHVPKVGERLAAAQADLVPDGRREWLRGNHERVQRHEPPPLAVQARGVALGGAYHHLGPDGAVVGQELALPQAGRAGALEQRDAARLDPLREPANELQRMHHGAVRCVGGAEHPRGPRDVLGLRLRQQLEPLHGPGQPPLLLHQLARPGELRLVAGERDRAAARVVGVDPLALGHTAHLGDRLMHGAPHRDRGLQTVPAGDPARRRREQRRAPSAVAPRRAEAGELTLDDRDSQRGVDLVQVVRGPQPRVAGARDRHVGLDVAG